MKAKRIEPCRARIEIEVNPQEAELLLWALERERDTYRTTSRNWDDCQHMVEVLNGVGVS